MMMHQSCPAKHDLRIRQGWRPRRQGAALGFGIAIHVGIADWYRSHDVNSAITAIRNAWPAEHPFDDYRDLNKCITVMDEYVREYPSESFEVVGYPDVPMIEVPFSLQLVDAAGKPVLTDGGQEIHYGGIFDALIEWVGQVYVVDHKSTSQLGDYYFDQFKPNNQIDGYVWAARQLTGRPVGGALINAIGVYKVGKTKFKRQLTSRTDAELAEWVVSVQADASEQEWHVKRGHYPLRKNSCIEKWGKCDFHDVHSLSNVHDRQKLLEQDYVVDPWDFERRDGNAV